jgi:predicted membrane metal-binding protein
MNLKSAFFRRYPLIAEGILFLLGQLILGWYIVTYGRQHLEVTWVMLGSAAILLIIIKNNWSKIIFYFFALLVGIMSQIIVFPSTNSQSILHTNKIIRGEFKVIDNPKRKTTQQVTFTAISLDTRYGNNKFRITAVELPWRSVSGVRKSDRFKATLQCKPSSQIRSIFSYQYLLLRRGINTSCKVIFLKSFWSKNRNPTFIEQLRKALPDISDYRLEYGLLLSLIFGIDSELPAQVEKSFKRAGLTHLLVFSGAQTSIIYYSLAFIFRLLSAFLNRLIYLGYSGYYEFTFSFLGTVAFCSLIGFESSTMRAVVASGLIVFSSIKETNQGMLYRMFLSLVILCAIWPGCFLEPGVQLTYAALIGIWYGLLFKNKLISYINMSLGISFLTNLISWLWFGSISIAGIVLNPFVAPVVSVFSVYLGIPAVMLIYSGSDTASNAAGVILWCLGHLESFVFWVSRFDWAYYNQSL